MKHDSVIVLFGASGDLALKKLLPSLYTLFATGFLKQTKIICVSRRPFTPAQLVKRSEPYIKVSRNFSLSKFTKQIMYLQHDFTDAAHYNELCSFINHFQDEHHLVNRVFYMSTSPKFYSAILDNLKKHGLNSGKGFSRVVLEKPFGDDLESSQAISKKLKSVFTEDQIYRTDHYLAKNIVQDMIALRSTNRVFGPLWNKENIDHIQIILSENFGVRDRGGFYDAYGAVKDVIQNHIIQLLSIVLSQHISHLTDDVLRDEKTRILRHTHIENVVLGQYSGYKSEKGIPGGSTTETLAALKVTVDLPEWRGVPIYILTGKQLKKRFSTIHVEFKGMDSSFLGQKNFSSNALTFQIQPNQGFYLRLNGRDPENDQITPIKMNFLNNTMFPNSPEAYTKLMKEIFRGNLFYFIRSDEVALQWKITDEILKKKHKLHIYQKGSLPRAASELIEKDGRKWKLDVEK